MNERMLELEWEAQDRYKEEAIERAKAAAVLVQGVPGECEYCGYDSPRLVNNACAPCRDLHKLG